jgi:hypothetical protein
MLCIAAVMRRECPLWGYQRTFFEVQPMSALPPKADFTHALAAPQVRKSEFQNGALFVHAITNFLLCPELATAFESLEFGACR